MEVFVGLPLLGAAKLFWGAKLFPVFFAAHKLRECIFFAPRAKHSAPPKNRNCGRNSAEFRYFNIFRGATAHFRSVFFHLRAVFSWFYELNASTV